MKLRLEDKNKAIRLRISGKSYSEIMSAIPNLSKSTLSGWLKNIKFTPDQKTQLDKHLEEISCNARVRTAWRKREEREKRIKEIFKNAEKEFPELLKNPFFLIGLVLYWAEGNRNKEIFQFTNSDPNAIKVMMRWLTKICGISKEKIKIRIYIHKIYAHENCEYFWSQITGIPVFNFQKTIYKPTPHKIKRNPDYKGCVQLRISKSAFFWKVIGWLNNLIKEYQIN